jgi:acyl carrier protein phosphodiesterase
MNWLAHLYLAEPSSAFRIGSLLPDMAPASALSGLPPEFKRGIQQHRRIDAFTDTHPIVRDSIRRFDPPFRRFGGILLDVFYDHILAREWADFSPTPFSEFTAEIYGSFDRHRDDLPPEVHARLTQMKAADLLSSYRHLSGVSAALDRITSRLSRPVPLAAAVGLLEKHYGAYQSEFKSFLPELRAHVTPHFTTPGNGLAE